MNNKLYKLFIGTALICTAFFTACKEDENNLSRAVLASVDVMYFDAESADPQIITVTSDADWIAETPEWVTVSPMTGHAGQTEVVITVQDNIRGEAPDNPRRKNVYFKGRNLESTATVLIRQDGDKFRDPKDYTIEEMESSENETVVRLPDMVVTALTSNGFMITDGTDYAYVIGAASAPAVGNKVTVLGEKFSDTNKMAYIQVANIDVTGSASVPVKEPFDITATLDVIKGNKYQLVSVTGAYDGSSLKVTDAANSVFFKDALTSFGFESLIGHNIKVTGYFAGKATPVVNVIPVIVEDLGLNEIIYFYDDFEWLDPWSKTGEAGKGPAGDQFGKFNSGEQCPQLQNVIYEGVSAYDALIEKGYNFAYVGSGVLKPASLKETAKNCTYLQSNYLKFGKTGYYAGLVLPPLKDVEDGANLLLTFDWGPMMSGKGNWDTAMIQVVVENGGSAQKFEIPEATLVHGSAGPWQKASVDLTGVKINENTKITIRNIDAHWPLDGEYGKTGLVRYFLDNIKIKKID